MGKTKEIVCIHYIAHGQCDLGSDASLYGICQHCDAYKKKPGAKPARPDNRRKKLDRIIEKESDKYE